MYTVISVHVQTENSGKLCVHHFQYLLLEIPQVKIKLSGVEYGGEKSVGQNESTEQCRTEIGKIVSAEGRKHARCLEIKT